MMLRRTTVLLVLVLAAVTALPGIVQSADSLAVEDESGSLAAPTLEYPRTFQLHFTHVVENTGSTMVQTQDLYLLMPQSNINQTVLEITFDPEPTEFLTDNWGQTVAHYAISNMPADSYIEIGWTADIRISDLSYFIDSGAVLDPADIAPETMNMYTQDETRYDIHNPIVQQAAQEAVADASGLYEQVRDTYQYVIDHLEYAREGGWDDAATVLERGNGSCTEYVFVLIALYRANEIPARHVGGSRLRADDDYLDTVFHRAVEVYLPGFGWVPLDVTLGDTQNDADGYFLKRYNSHFIISTAGGRSSLLGWNYHSNLRVADSSQAQQVSSSRSAYWKSIDSEPIMNVHISSDSVEYVAQVDDRALFTAVISNGYEEEVSGLADNAFVSTIDGAVVPVSFIESATSGTYTGILDLAMLPLGEHEFVLMVTDSARDTTASATTSFSIVPAPVEPVPPVSELTVNMRTVSRIAGRNVFQMAVADIMVVDASGQPVSGATVLAQWSGLTAGSDSAVTDSNGVAIMQSDQVKNQSGTFTLTVLSVVIDGISSQLEGDTVSSISS